MNDLTNLLIRFFEQDNWNFQLSAEKPLLRLPFKGDHGTWNCFAQAIPEQQRVIFYSVMPFPTPEERRVAMAEFITRANYGLLIGNFEMDFRDGEVRYKTSVDVTGGELTYEMIRTLVIANVETLDYYLPGLLRVAMEDCDPAEAVAMVEDTV